MLFKPDPLTIRRFRKFKRIRRGYVALILVLSMYGVSLASELFIGNRPLMMRWDGDWYFPAFNKQYYSAKLFGSKADIETDFRKLREKPSFRDAGGFMIMPLHPYSPTENITVKGDPPPARPSRVHPMGTDDRGRDVLARIVYGFRISVSFAILVTLGAYMVGITLGSMQGFFGGKFDLGMQRFTEVWAALPFLYVVTLLASVITPSFWMLVLILITFSWIGIDAYTRAEVLRERNKDYVTAARAMGAGWHRTLFGHVLGNSLTSAITLFPMALVGNIFALTALDYLGYGLPPPTPSWGELFSQGRSNITSWWLITFPFLALVTTLLLLTFVGEAVREAWDPRDFRAPPVPLDSRREGRLRSALRRFRSGRRAA